ncbi:hypothetical protein [Saccharibacillus endophyticus]|uniref:DUF3137 domain-containing protein n=1 Tax=Saccharibacillus endophyticus TaxID=2060666 RepID=A0ABQ1ZVV8_9BACL|nr:hypothetical protein [Saccharibacillus endophyticus]GGH78095.1 hypothetical protein GCM10007362_22860 [Saccharibacillus endophyticus]
MLTWTSDCLVFDIDFKTRIQDQGDIKTPSPFEKMHISKMKDNVVEIDYTWLDSIKVNDKIFRKEQKRINGWIFMEEKTMFIFSNSESSVTYFISRLTEIFQFKIKKIPLFSKWRKFLLKKDILKRFKIINVHIVKEATAFDQNDIRKVAIKTLDDLQIKRMISNDLITNLTFETEEKKVFFIDKDSAISFPDTLKEADIFDCLSLIVKELIDIND